MFKYKQYDNAGIIEIIDAERNLTEISTQCVTAAFDTENYILFDGVQVTTQELFDKCKPFKNFDGTCDLEALRSHISCVVYSWQVYDEVNGFYMTNDFETWLNYMCRAHYKYVWCYNAKFDFAQIDYAILSNDKWTLYDREDTHKKGKPYQYYSLHDNMGNRYSYKLWFPYRDNTRHKHTHALELRDFANIFKGGLAEMLDQLKVCDNAGNPIRKLSFEDYNNIDMKHLSREQIDYYRNDVAGLYFGIKSYDKTINAISKGNISLYGCNTNVMTAGGIAKKELLHILYPKTEPLDRIKEYQDVHKMWAELDWQLRNGKLYRGGITFLNNKFKNKLVTHRFMYRYDVNSEYPFSMFNIPDLIGNPIEMPYETWKKAPAEFKKGFECILCLKSVIGEVKDGYLGFWFDPFINKYVDFIDEEKEHLMFEFEFEEYKKWYDINSECYKVILFRRGINHYKKFVNTFYEMKTDAKREKKKAIELCAKLLLNSSYGKLAERATRIKGHYEFNEEKQCVSFKVDKEATDTKGIMSVAVGSLVTAYARVWLMSNIRKAYDNKMAEEFVYCDTDSIHGFIKLPDEVVDNFRLGAFKLEAKCNAVKYLAPKTYFDCKNVRKGQVRMKNLEMHSKGIPLKAIKDCMPNKRIKIDVLDKLFTNGKKFHTLQALNVRGGKCLIPIEKYLVKPDDEPDVIISGEQMTFIEEL